MSKAQSQAPADAIRLKIESDPATLADVRHRVEEFALSGGFDATAVGEIALVVNEALANVMRHAYHGATDRPIEIEAKITGARQADREILIRIRDWGSGVNPETLAKVHRPHDPLKPGGLGLICLRSMMDSAVFHPQPDGMLLEMTRRKNRR
jgi:serine/threonine-protein kinase RsbW